MSRLQPKLACHIQNGVHYSIKNISVRNNLGTVTYDRTKKNQKKIHAFEEAMAQDARYFTISQSTSEITVCCEADLLRAIKKDIDDEPKYFNHDPPTQ